MRRRRHRLEVSTFPFLAVLLCAMGSLILILLVLDRRAKAAAIERAQKAVAEQLERRRKEREEAQTRLDQELADRRRQREEHHREQLRLAEEMQQQIDRKRRDIDMRIQQTEADVQKTRDQMQAAKTDAEIAQARFEALRRQLLLEKNRLVQQEGEVKQRQSKASAAKDQVDASKSGLARLTADLELLERTLAELKEARKLEEHTYSVVPYKGRRGDDRKPIYIECAAEGLILHPDREKIPAWSSTKLLEEIRNRYGKQTQGSAGKPYVLFLIRPSAIENYYSAMGALRGEPVDFGYELVDADWVLDFSDEQKAVQPWASNPKMQVEPPQVTQGTKAPQGTNYHLLGGNGSHGDGGSDLNTPSEPFTTTGGGPRGRGPNGSGSNMTGPGTTVSMNPGTGSSGPGGSGPFKGGLLGNGGSGGNGGNGGNSGNGNGSGNPGAPLTFGGGQPGTSGNGGSSTGSQGSGNGAGYWQSSGGAGGQAGSTTQGGTPGKGSSANGYGSSAGSGVGGGNSTSSGSGQPGGIPGGSPGNQGRGPGTGSPTSSGGTGGGDDDTIHWLPPPPVSGPGGGHGGSNGPGGSNGGDPGTIASSGPSQGGSSGGAGSRGGSQGGSGTAGGAATGSPSVGTPPPGAAQKSGNAGPSGPPGYEARSGSAPPGQPSADDPPAISIAPRGDSPGRDKAPLAPRPVLGSRDWIVPIECTGTGLIVYPGRDAYPLAGLAESNKAGSSMVANIKQAIAKRQASVRQGEPPYRPIIRFLVRPDGLEAMHRAYPLLVPLGIPMFQINMESDEKIDASIYRP